MANMFACVCNQPQRLMAALEPVRNVLVTRSPVVSWGYGYVESGEVLLSRHPRPAPEGIDFFSALGALQSDYVVGLASADEDLAGPVNTQPFRFRRWLFAQEGGITNFAEVAPRVLEDIPAYMRRNIAGRTAAEHVFHVFLAGLHEAGLLARTDLAHGEVTRALRRTFDRLRAAIGDADRELGNLVLTNSRSVHAVRLTDPLYVRRLKEHIDRKRPESELKAVLIVSSKQPITDPGFEEVPPGSVVSVSRDISVNLATLQ